jgi:protein TonB
MVKQASRYVVAIAIGAGVTFGLLFIMQYMIASGQAKVGDNGGYRIVDFVRVDRPEVVEEKKKKPEKPPEPEVQPQMPEPQISNFESSVQIAMVRPQVTMNTNIGTLGFGQSDGEYLPIVKVQPIYPQRALQRGLEGSVLVQYTVTTTGETKDVVVVQSSNQVFDRAAIESAKKYKYKPRIIDGTPVEVPGVTTLIEFKIQD